MCVCFCIDIRENTTKVIILQREPGFVFPLFTECVCVCVTTGTTTGFEFVPFNSRLHIETKRVRFCSNFVRSISGCAHVLWKLQIFCEKATYTSHGDEGDDSGTYLY